MVNNIKGYINLCATRYSANKGKCTNRPRSLLLLVLFIDLVHVHKPQIWVRCSSHVRARSPRFNSAKPPGSGKRTAIEQNGLWWRTSFDEPDHTDRLLGVQSLAVHNPCSSSALKSSHTFICGSARGQRNNLNYVKFQSPWPEMENSVEDECADSGAETGG